jgi:hypothetical protein
LVNTKLAGVGEIAIAMNSRLEIKVVEASTINGV